MNTKQRTDTRDLVAVYRGARTSSMHPRAASQSTLAASIPNRGPICLARRAPASPSRISRRIRQERRVFTHGKLFAFAPRGASGSAHPGSMRPPTASSEVRLREGRHCCGSRCQTRRCARNSESAYNDWRIFYRLRTGTSPRHGDDALPQKTGEIRLHEHPTCVVFAPACCQIGRAHV